MGISRAKRTNIVIKLAVCGSHTSTKGVQIAAAAAAAAVPVNSLHDPGVVRKDVSVVLKHDTFLKPCAQKTFTGKQRAS